MVILLSVQWPAGGPFSSCGREYRWRVSLVLLAESWFRATYAHIFITILRGALLLSMSTTGWEYSFETTVPTASCWSHGLRASQLQPCSGFSNQLSATAGHL
ncbi:hypothetical protein CEXT_287951 [Caerostris extrusa]|uniref:Uncharacterized protein n=1 Tax=Caerostris extrusa TaxID=172846 RepID=A0AAV4T4Z8_CAEEX|nr:hypothetical protein CEXT_287951 [Caerostris extrusa]